MTRKDITTHIEALHEFNLMALFDFLVNFSHFGPKKLLKFYTVEITTKQLIQIPHRSLTKK